MPRSRSAPDSAVLEKPGRREAATARTSISSLTPASLSWARKLVERLAFISDREQRALGHRPRP
jgi:hypothetical protein